MREDIKKIISKVYEAGWQAVFDRYAQLYPNVQKERLAEFTELFSLECLLLTDEKTPDLVFWQIVKKWQDNCKLTSFHNDLPEQEKMLIYEFAATFRKKLNLRLMHRQFPHFSGHTSLERFAIICWREVFLSSYGVLYQYDTEELLHKDLLAGSLELEKEDSLSYYSWLLRMSMFYPFDGQRFMVNVEKLLLADIPAYCKVILVMWLTALPRYNATQQHRQRLLNYFAHTQRVTHAKIKDWMDPYFMLLAEWLMISFFRAAYLHEDNAQGTFQFGDFITEQMGRQFPAFKEPLLYVKPDKTQRKIRVGYISSRFVMNAVTFYMANRILHHDRNTFEVHIFALGKGEDKVTELLVNNCDRFTRIADSSNYQEIAQKVRESQVDILLFADIGMDISTYLLGGLRLAPVQCALLGHASTTGLPYIDYYFTSEIESKDAYRQYREKVVKMPNAGAAQLMPPGLQHQRQRKVTREKLGIPEDAFVFVSCANGMKHIPERDYVWTEILRRIPQAWILMKPFSAGDVDQKLIKRFEQINQDASANGRLLYVSGCVGHDEVFDYLELANAQLDSYPFNGWTTTVEAMCMALPTITQEGNGYRSRIGAGFLRAMGIQEGIAVTDEEYIEWAVRFANDPKLCQWVKNRIKVTRKHLLFKNIGLQIEYEKALIKIFNQIEGR